MSYILTSGGKKLSFNKHASDYYPSKLEPEKMKMNLVIMPRSFAVVEKSTANVYNETRSELDRDKIVLIGSIIIEPGDNIGTERAARLSFAWEMEFYYMPKNKEISWLATKIDAGIMSNILKKELHEWSLKYRKEIFQDTVGSLETEDSFTEEYEVPNAGVSGKDYAGRIPTEEQPVDMHGRKLFSDY
jgi:hypothetical protein